MNYFRNFIFGILAGISISIGGTVFLSLDDRILGAVFFTVGLFTVCTFGFDLFTGKVCYVFDRGLEYAAGLPFIWAGNFAGAWLTASAERLTRIGPALTAHMAAAFSCRAGPIRVSLSAEAVSQAPAKLPAQIKGRPKAYSRPRSKT